MTPSTAEIYHPSFDHKQTSADFFTEGIRRVSLDSTSAALPPTRSRTHTPSGSSSTPTPIDSPVGRKPTSQTSSPGTASSPHSTTGPASLPSLLKTKSKWTSLLSSHSSSTPASVDPEVTLTHTTPFHSHLSTSGAYVPPSGAPGFKPTQGPDRDGAHWDDLDEKGVELVGRRESTIDILSSNAAEMVRRPPRPSLGTSHRTDLSSSSSYSDSTTSATSTTAGGQVDASLLARSARLLARYFLRPEREVGRQAQTRSK